MNNRQICKMICTEKLSYAVSGMLTGGVIGLFLHMKFCKFAIFTYFGEPWTVLVRELFFVLFVVEFASVISVVKPVKRIFSNTVTEAISEF